MQASRLSIARRLALVLSLILVLLLISCLYGIMKLRAVTKDTTHMVETSLATERHASDWYRLIANSVERTTAIAKSADPSLAAFFAPIAAESSKESSRLQQQIEKMIASDEERELFAQIAVDRKTYLAARDEIYRLKKEGDTEALAKVYTGRFEPSKVAFQASVARMLELQRHALDDYSERIRAASAQATQLLTALCIGSLLLAALLAWRLALSITRPLAQAREVAEQIAAMDLSGQGLQDPQGRYAQDRKSVV